MIGIEDEEEGSLRLGDWVARRTVLLLKKMNGVKREALLSRQ